MFKGLILFGQFFTKLNLPFPIDDPMDKFRKNIQYLTLFGFVFGCLEGLGIWLIAQIFPLWFSWICYWVLDGLLTGGFHLDALADTADGFFSSRTADKIFTIMKDSRLGTMGSLALLYFYALNIALGIVILPKLSALKLALLSATLTMVTKVGLTILFYHMHYAGSPHGLSKIWLNVAVWRIVLAQIIAIIIIGLIFSISGLIGYCLILIGALWYRRKITKVLGGFSGDTLGAFACLTQLLFMIGITVAIQAGISF
ncbi:adenosylcobinamide-GDP ribazoletransferase [Lactobacillus sp. 3B(2020)]|uniref:adenosylcobinamide-GDP ribazoletransferase n=1 Tax=Lactobacillus sp. 3B(2020) TaxID=2695882 RepID=UPI0015DE8A76|nr:adenosylcobinamide-GDP ribazoletransferase [Lactobacillus sp. 3B(2020)]QLL69190.1 adenosylcobinamide-GDP ribazoletransferase [Lactobacillus sp. 3B(2020)]